MTSTTASTQATQRRTITTLAASGIVLSAIVIFAGNYNVPKGENGGPSEGLFTAILCAVIAAVLFGLVVPRVRNYERAGIVLGVLMVLSLVVFWSGVTPILGAAAFALSLRELTAARSATVVRWVSLVATALVVVWTLLNSHLF